MHIHGGDVYTHKNVIDFSANINFKGMPESVAKAAREAVDLCSSYPDTDCKALREAIGERERVVPDRIICGNGAADLIFTLVVARKPGKALLMVPTFYEYEQALLAVNCQVEKYSLKEKHGFAIQEDFLKRITPETDIVFFCNPNNPTGVLTKKEFLEKVLKKCERCDALLVLDECFNDFLDEPGRSTMKEFLMTTEHLFILKAFTKIYAMAGLRLGYGLSHNSHLLSRMKRMAQPWNVSVVAQNAGIAAAGEILFAEESRKEIKAEREKIKQELADTGYLVYGSMANYIFFQGPRNLFLNCLARGILIRDCSNYEGLSVGWYRIAVRGREENHLLLTELKKEMKIWQGQL